MKIKIKKTRPEAVIPEIATNGSACFDLTACDMDKRHERGVWTYYTGLSMEIPKGYGGYIYPRSSIYKKGVHLSNSVGVIDSDYRGEIIIKFRDAAIPGAVYATGDRVAQMEIRKVLPVEFEEIEELSETERGEGGHGSSGE